MGHSSLVGKEGCQVHWLVAIILWEGLHLGTMATGPLFGVEPHRPMTGRTELPVRLEKKIIYILDDLMKQIHK